MVEMYFCRKCQATLCEEHIDSGHVCYNIEMDEPIVRYHGRATDALCQVCVLKPENIQKSIEALSDGIKNSIVMISTPLKEAGFLWDEYQTAAIKRIEIPTAYTKTSNTPRFDTFFTSNGEPINLKEQKKDEQ